MANTLLRYALTPDPFPLEASPQSGNANVVALTLVATNATSSGVTLQGLLVTLPTGDGAAQLTANAKDIGPVPPPGWKLAGTQYPKDAVQYTFQPTGDGTVGSQQALVFIFNSVAVNSTPGTCEVVIAEGSNNCQPPNCPTDTRPLTKFPTGWGTVSFWANPPIIPAGGATTLHWSGPAGATYSIEFYTPQTGVVNVPAAGQPPLANTGQYPPQGQSALQLEQNTTFYLTVSEVIGKQTYSAQQNVPVTVEMPPPQIVKFTGTIDTTGATPALVLKWVSDYASYCTLSNNPTEKRTTSSPTDGYPIPLTATNPLAHAYTLTAYNTSNQSAASTISVQWELLNTVAVSQFAARLAVSPDGEKLYVGLSWAKFDGVTGYENNYLVALDTQSLQVIQTIEIPGSPSNMAVSQDGRQVFVVTNGDTNLSAIDTTTWAMTNTTIPDFPVGLAVNPSDPNVLYVSQSSAEQVLMLDAATHQPIGQPFHVGHEPTSVAVSRHGEVMYTINYNSTSISLVKTATGKLSIISDPHMNYWFVLPRLAVAPDGGRAYVTSNGSNTLLVIDTATEHVVQALQCSAVQGFGAAVALTGDGMQAFVTAFDWQSDHDDNGSVVVINTTTLPVAVVQVLPVQSSPVAVAVAPDGVRFYVANQDSQSISVFQATLVGGVSQ